MAKSALITGVTGQDGSYLAELLLGKGYQVHGLLRRASTFNRGRIEHLHAYEGKSEPNLILHYGDITDSANLIRVIGEVCPDEIYHLAAQSHVHVSFQVPEYTADADAVGTLRLLDAVKALRLEGRTRIYNAGSSELFGKAHEIPQSERTPFHPRSPYAVAKLYAYWIGINYREAYGMFVSNGILFNHESPRRGESFVTRKITLSIANIVAGKQRRLYLGNLDAVRDWGYAPDYVKAMWMILQHPEPDDFVIATGEGHTVREFVELAFREVGVDIEWSGRGTDEVGVDRQSGRTLVAISPSYLRPSEVDHLQGDAAKARRLLGWTPTVDFPGLVKLMVAADLQALGGQGEAVTASEGLHEPRALP